VSGATSNQGVAGMPNRWYSLESQDGAPRTGLNKPVFLKLLALDAFLKC